AETTVDSRIEQAHSWSTSVYVDGSYLLNDSSRNLFFDSADFDDLSSLQPGDDGGEFRAGVNFRRDPVGDIGVGGGLAVLGDQEVVTEDELARQKLRIATADVEVGYRPLLGTSTDVRLVGGLRALTADTRSYWETEDKSGRFDDSLWAVGPRVGIELTQPI